VTLPTPLVRNGPYWHNHLVQQRRQRRPLFTLPGSCGLCGHDEAVITEVRTVRQGLAWMNPAWTPEVELFEVCSRCGARRQLEDARAA
jgi:hypothetical protein